MFEQGKVGFDVAIDGGRRCFISEAACLSKDLALYVSFYSLNSQSISSALASCSRFLVNNPEKVTGLGFAILLHLLA